MTAGWKLSATIRRDTPWTGNCATLRSFGTMELTRMYVSTRLRRARERLEHWRRERAFFMGRRADIAEEAHERVAQKIDDEIRRAEIDLGYAQHDVDIACGTRPR